jgi:NAD(P)-dependent dehydrogenase (short-subunit alcohol dehydrogenase family)
MKGGVEVLTRYLAKELGPRGISVNTLAPGAIETDFGGGAVRDNKDLNRMIASMTALGRVGLPTTSAAPSPCSSPPRTTGSPASASRSPAGCCCRARGRARVARPASHHVPPARSPPGARRRAGGGAAEKRPARPSQCASA